MEDVPGVRAEFPRGQPGSDVLLEGMQEQGDEREEEGEGMSHYPVLVLSRTGQSVDELLLPYMENCCEDPPIDFMEFYEDEGCDVDWRTGKRGYWQNPNAKWDWCVVGGRFSGLLRLNRSRQYWIDHFHERFVEPYLDCTATVVDCHI